MLSVTERWGLSGTAGCTYSWKAPTGQLEWTHHDLIYHHITPFHPINTTIMGRSTFQTQKSTPYVCNDTHWTYTRQSQPKNKPPRDNHAGIQFIYICTSTPCHWGVLLINHYQLLESVWEIVSSRPILEIFDRDEEVVDEMVIGETALIVLVLVVAIDSLKMRGIAYF